MTCERYIDRTIIEFTLDTVHSGQNYGVYFDEYFRNDLVTKPFNCALLITINGGTVGCHNDAVKYNTILNRGHDDVIKWKHFPRYRPFVRGIHRLPVNSPHKGQWRGDLMFSLICAWTNGWTNNRDALYDVNVMNAITLTTLHSQKTIHSSSRASYGVNIVRILGISTVL